METVLPSATCKGEPVNVATGDFIQQWPIIQIPGLLPLSLHRTYKSTSNAKGLFGPKWADEWSRCLHILDGNIIYQDSDGANFTFITPHRGDPCKKCPCSPFFTHRTT